MRRWEWLYILPKSWQVKKKLPHVICCYLCFSMQPVVRLLLTEGWYRIFNIHSNHSACCAPQGDTPTGTDESAQMSTQMKWNLKTPSPCLDWESNLWQLLCLNHQCNALATGLTVLSFKKKKITYRLVFLDKNIRTKTSSLLIKCYPTLRLYTWPLCMSLMHVTFTT